MAETNATIAGSSSQSDYALKVASALSKLTYRNSESTPRDTREISEPVDNTSPSPISGSSASEFHSSEDAPISFQFYAVNGIDYEKSKVKLNLNESIHENFSHSSEVAVVTSSLVEAPSVQHTSSEVVAATHLPIKPSPVKKVRNANYIPPHLRQSSEVHTFIAPHLRRPLEVQAFIPPHLRRPAEVLTELPAELHTAIPPHLRYDRIASQDVEDVKSVGKKKKQEHSHTLDTSQMAPSKKPTSKKTTSKKPAVRSYAQVVDDRAGTETDTRRASTTQQRTVTMKTVEQIKRELLDKYLPPELRNVPRPIFLSQVRAQEAAKQQALLPPDQRNIKTPKPKSRAYAVPTIIQKASASQLVHQLAANEKVQSLITKNDFDGTDSAVTVILNSPENVAPEEVEKMARWRWFNADIKSTLSDESPAETKGFLAHELVGWDGNWAPAPIEWDERTPYNSDSPRNAKRLEKWVGGRMEEALAAPFVLDTTADGFTSGVIPASGTRKQWQERPADCAFVFSAIHYGAIDWDSIETFPPKDPYSKVKVRQEQTSNTAMHNFAISMKEMRQQAKLDRERAEKENLAAIASHNELARTYHQQPNLFIPKANIYIRPACARDVAQIAGIYDYYVTNTIKVPETEPTGPEEWSFRLKTAEEARLPFLVAVLKNTKGQGKQKTASKNGHGSSRYNQFGDIVHKKSWFNQQLPFFGAETVVGFCYAEEWSSPMAVAFKFACEIEPYVHPGYYGLGICKTLFDRIMPALDPNYMTHHGTDFYVENSGPYQEGGLRDIKKIVVSVFFSTACSKDSKDSKDFEWQKEYLEMHWDFDHIATFPTMCEKFGEGYNLALFIRETAQAQGCSSWYPKQPNRVCSREKRILAAEAAKVGAAVVNTTEDSANAGAEEDAARELTLEEEVEVASTEANASSRGNTPTSSNC